MPLYPVFWKFEMEKTLGQKRNFSLSVVVSTTSQLNGLNASFFDRIFLGNPFCPKIQDNPVFCSGELERAATGFPLKEKIILNMPVCPLEEEMVNSAEILNRAKDIGLKAVCVSTPGFAYWIKKEFPSLKVYFDSFANVYSLQDVRFMKELGVIGGLLSCEVDLAEREYILKNSDLEIITPIAGYIPIAFSRYCFFYPKELPENCPNPCQNNCVLSYPGSGQVKQKGRVIYSGKSFFLLEHLGQLQKKGFKAFRVEGWIMAPEKINKITDLLCGALSEGYNLKQEKEIFGLFPEGLCNGFLFSGRGMDYCKENG